MSTLDSEVINLIARMRVLIRKEFGVLLPLRQNNSIKTYCYYGSKSNQGELVKLSQDLHRLIYKDDDQEDGYNTRVENVLLGSKNKIEVDNDLNDGTHHTSSHNNNEDSSLSSINHDLENDIYIPWTSSFLELLASSHINKPVKIIHPSIETLIINKPLKLVYANLKLNELFSSDILNSNSIYIQDVTQDELPAFDKSISILKLSVFLWSCGIRLSGEHLLSSLQPYPAFRFKKWPDFFMLPEHTKIAIALSRTSYSVNGLMETLDITKEASIKFLNAAYLCGSLDGVDTEPDVTETASPIDLVSGHIC